jgi:tRNA pseudouridine13 synthase
MLPYITASLPGISGTLRAQAEFFRVEELPLYQPLGEGAHLYLKISKSAQTTRQVARQLEQLFALRRGDVGYAGLKDKFAQTTQIFSIPFALAHQPQEQRQHAIEAIVERIHSQMAVQVKWAIQHHNKLKTGHLLGNRFQITITQLPTPIDLALRQAQAIAEQLRSQGLPNYFGDQRFGRHGDNAAQGRAILSGAQQVRDPWLRKFLISSFQSALCNAYLSRRLETGKFARLLTGDVAKKYATGGIFDVGDWQNEQPRYLAQEISFTAPIYGYKMRAASGEAGELELEILHEHDLSLEQWRRARIEGTRRLGRLLVPDLQLAAVGETIVADFSLPKGAFATIVLREIMKNEASALPNDEEELQEEE